MLKKGFLVKQDAGSDDDKSDIDWNLYRGVNELTLSYKKDQSKLECTYGKKNNESTIELKAIGLPPYSFNIINHQYIDENGIMITNRIPRLIRFISRRINDYLKTIDDGTVHQQQQVQVHQQVQQQYHDQHYNGQQQYHNGQYQYHQQHFNNYYGRGQY